MKIREVKKSDLDSIVKIESNAFQMAEDFTRKDMIPRIENYPDTFLVAEINGQVVGHVFGPSFSKPYIEDEIYFKNHPNQKEDKYQTVLSLAVAPEYRHQGIASALLKRLFEIAKSENRIAVTLTCFPELFTFYEKFGFVNKGKTSDDIPDPDEKSRFNMLKKLSE